MEARIYQIFLDNQLIETTTFEHADAPMGVVFGQITFPAIEAPYDFIKSYCTTNKIPFDDFPTEKVISTQTIPSLKVISERGQEINGLGNQISGMDSDSFELTIPGIPYPLFAEEFPHHVNADKERFS